MNRRDAEMIGELRLRQRHLIQQRVGHDRAGRGEPAVKVDQQHREPLLGAALPEADDPVVQPALFLDHLPHAAIRDIRVFAERPVEFAVVQSLRDRRRQDPHRIRMARDEHALHGEQVARQKNQNALVAAVVQRARARRPACQQAIDVGVLGVGFDQQLVGAIVPRAAVHQRRNLLLARQQRRQQLRAMKRITSGIRHLGSR